MKQYYFLFFILSLFVGCSHSEDISTSDEENYEPVLINMAFKAVDNPYGLIEDVMCTVVGDSVVDCWVPTIMDNKNLIPEFEFLGEECYFDGIPGISGVSCHDFKAPVNLEIKTGGKVKEYTVYVHSFTGLPVLWIETEKRKDITSKEDYLKAHFKLVEDVYTRSPGDVIELDGQIKGRGNSTWSFPKKPYRLKFNDKVSFFNEPSDKAWVLLANYSDKTSLRNATALYMGSISSLEYTPKFHFVDVMLNGRYNGTYQLGDKLKISKNRVNVGDDGFLMEVDSRAIQESDARYFYVNHISNPINIKDPDVEYDDDNFNYAKEYISKVDEVLFSDTFTDPDEGWQKYMDMDSFVDWYLINEISKNNDANFFSSCYMNLKRGAKLKMGPLWDFDIAFGNINYNQNFEHEGFWVKTVPWFTRLFEYHAFVARVKTRFAYFYGRKEEIMENINADARYLKYSVIENDNKWHTFYNDTWPNYDIWGSYLNEVQSMKKWLTNRFEWLNNEINKL